MTHASILVAETLLEQEAWSKGLEVMEVAGVGYVKRDTLQRGGYSATLLLFLKTTSAIPARLGNIWQNTLSY